MPTLLVPLAAWILALKMASDSDDREPLVLGAIAGGVFAAFAWLDVAFFHGSTARAVVATPLYVAAGAVLVKLFSRVEGVLAGTAVVVLGTGIMFAAVPGLVRFIVPDKPVAVSADRRVTAQPVIPAGAPKAPRR